MSDDFKRAYGCCKCQKYHYEDEPLFRPHNGFQSKHGIAPRDTRFRQNCIEEEVREFFRDPEFAGQKEGGE